ncbi:MAG: hypothetical protein JXR51_09540 [Bacteroidales bacterium]|nr:hypothetical protein [Bacteroidales bacterium]MBN2757407.1 hypothetical protein [Bacteroidales bacterium]
MKKTNKLNLAKFYFNIVAIIAFSIFLMSSGCKSKKEIVSIDDQTEDVVKVNPEIEKSKATLQKLIDQYDSYTIEEKEVIIANIKSLDLKNNEIDAMINTLETKIAEEKAKIKKENEDAAKPENKLKKYFDEIANASSETDADNKINQALQMFSSASSNVLIIISENDNMKDYDKPTNISKYLNYLKDTKTNVNIVNEIKFDENNKIKTLILKKIK